MPTVFVSIGRKVTTSEGHTHDMESVPWYDFRRAVENTLSHAGSIVGDFPYGRGRWGGESEQSTGFLVFLAHEDSIAQLRPLLAAIGADYGQAAVGFTVHDDRQGESWIDCA